VNTRSPTRAPASADGDRALIIIPTYNEAENLEKLIIAIWERLPKVNILVVDDASPDGTGRLADAIAMREPRLHAIHRAGKLGLGTAYLAGFRWALARAYLFIFEMDAYFSHQPRFLADFLRTIDDADLVIGCRYMSGGGVENWPWRRVAISRGGNLYARVILGLPYTDLTGGFKCFRREVLETLDLDAVSQVGYGFQIELTWRTLHAGFDVEQVPIVFPDRTAGKSKMSGNIVREAALGVWRLRLGG